MRLHAHEEWDEARAERDGIRGDSELPCWDIKASEQRVRKVGRLLRSVQRRRETTSSLELGPQPLERAEGQGAAALYLLEELKRGEAARSAQAGAHIRRIE